MSTKTAKNKTAEDCLGQEFLIIREFDAPREMVFAAWTDPKQLAEWWGPRGFTNPVCNWEARPGAKIYVVMRAPNGTDYPMGGEVREVMPPEKLVFTSGALDEQGKMMFELLHTATFTEQAGKTRLTLESRVIQTSAGAGKYLGGFEAGFTQSLEKLTELLANAPKTVTAQPDEKSMATENNPTEPLVVERTFNATIAQVWKALTDADEMRRWYFDLKEFKPEPGFEFEFTVEHEGMTYCHLCKVTTVVPQKTLAYTWRYKGHEGNSLVTFELSAEGGQTKLKLTHEGLETFPQTASFARKNFNAGWTHLVGSSLKDFVENVDREIFISRDFAAPRELVWEVWTNPKHVVNWWGPRGFTTTIETMDFRVGGVWLHTMRGPDGTKYPNRHVFREIVKPEKIVCSHGGGREDGPGASFIATWTFEALAPHKTRVSMRGVFASAAERDFVVKEFGAGEGGKQTLERLGEYLAKMQTPAGSGTS